MPIRFAWLLQRLEDGFYIYKDCFRESEHDFLVSGDCAIAAIEFFIPPFDVPDLALNSAPKLLPITFETFVFKFGVYFPGLNLVYEFSVALYILWILA